MGIPSSAAQSPAPVGEAWGDAIVGTTKQVLWTRLRTWWNDADHGGRQGPFGNERLTGAEVFWLAVCAVAKQEISTEDEAERRLRAAPDNDLIRFSLDLSQLNLQKTNLNGVQLQRAILRRAQLQGANLRFARLDGTFLRYAMLQGADLSHAQMQVVNLSEAQLQGADLSFAQLQDGDLSNAQLQGATLYGAHVNAETQLVGTNLCEHPSRQWHLAPPWSPQFAPALGDIRWGGVGTIDLTQIQDWEAVSRLGDERQIGRRAGVDAHQQVVRAYRQVATQLRAQGVTEVADRLSHRALSYERRVFLRRGNIPRYLGSWLLAILAGYGYRPGRTLFWYLVVICGFAFGYFQATHGVLTFGLAPSQVQPLQWCEAIILSVSAFHGRGFFQPVQSLGDPVAILAAMEAVVGLLIEISFIATFTQRFFGSK